MELLFLQRKPCNGADLACFPSKPSEALLAKHLGLKWVSHTLVQGRGNSTPPPQFKRVRKIYGVLFLTAQP